MDDFEREGSHHYLYSTFRVEIEKKKKVKVQKFKMAEKRNIISV